MSSDNMSFLDKLKEFIKVDLHLNVQIGVKTVNIINNDPTVSPPAVIDTDGHVTISWNKLTPEQQTKIKPLIAHDVRTHDALLLEDESKERAEDVDISEHETDDRALINFFRGKVPSTDLTALRSALYLRKKFREGAPREEIYRLRREIIDRYSERGRVISNLCSSGYFESWFKPLYENLSRNRHFNPQEFTAFYERIIREGAFAVFVSSGMSSDDVTAAIEDQYTKEIRYGITAPLVNVHGIGKTNVESVNVAIYNLKEKYPHLKIKKTESMNIISARLSFE
jgi:hypothetical protein